jgi:hypothetical protein
MLTICATALLPRLLSAQILLRLQLEHTQLVRYEAVNVFLSILNEAPYPLRFDGDNGARLHFSIERGLDTAADRIDERPLIENVTVDAGRSRDILCDISRRYDLGPVGNYSVRAIIEWRGRAYQSGQVRFDVVNGLPISKDTRTIWTDKEFVREFSLCYLAREGSEHLFLSVDDKRGGINYGVFDLGAIIRLHPPVLRVGRDGKVRVLHQSGLGRYTLNSLEVTGEQVRLTDQSYVGEDGKPFGRTAAPATEGPDAEAPRQPSEKKSSLRRGRFSDSPVVSQRHGL